MSKGEKQGVGSESSNKNYLFFNPVKRGKVDKFFFHAPSPHSDTLSPAHWPQNTKTRLRKSSTNRGHTAFQTLGIAAAGAPCAK